MLLAFVLFFVFTFAFLQWRKTFGRNVYTAAVVLACAFSLFLAYVSVSNVWIPHPLSDYVFSEQNALGEYEGVFPWSRLSYPLYLNVYHTPFEQLTLIGSYGRGQACFSIFLQPRKFSWPMVPFPTMPTLWDLCHCLIRLTFFFLTRLSSLISCLLCLLSLTLLEHY